MDIVPLHQDFIPQSLYLHYPLCKHHCSYCDFNVVVAQRQSSDFGLRWVKSIEKHLTHFLEDKKSVLQTLYLGGGTPSLLGIDELTQLKSILQKFFRFENLEWTMECNPESLTHEKLLSLRELGVNRLSVGVQTFIPQQLRRLERLATHDHIEKILVDVQDLFTNFSIDLMIGIADQTLETLKEDLKRVRSLKPPHISVYILTLEEDHKLKTSPAMAPRLADDELISEMYLHVCDTLDELNYEHYEVSNFARAGFRSQHNSNYWNSSKSYLGIGPGAHGYLRLQSQCIRYENIRDPAKWGEHAVGFENFERLDAEQQLLEDFYLRLRTQQPISLSEINQSIVEEYEKNGWIKILHNHLTLTRSGQLLIESLAPRLMR